LFDTNVTTMLLNVSSTTPYNRAAETYQPGNLCTLLHLWGKRTVKHKKIIT